MTGTADTAPAAIPRKRALLVGINRYQHSEIPPLNGCVQDVEVMASILERNFGFPVEHITLLRDEEATRTNILAALDVLVEHTGPDDTVVVHYSGHGSQMTDREGDEPDRMDETILPHDTGRAPHANRDITDDELYARLLRLGEKTRNITLIFDCCHSGSITRDAFGELSRWVAPDDRPLDQLPPSPVADDLARATTRDVGPSGWL